LVVPEQQQQRRQQQQQTAVIPQLGVEQQTAMDSNIKIERPAPAPLAEPQRTFSAPGLALEPLLYPVNTNKEAVGDGPGAQEGTDNDN
jgi:hypothetical protein